MLNVLLKWQNKKIGKSSGQKRLTLTLEIFYADFHKFRDELALSLYIVLQSHTATSITQVTLSL